MSRTDLRRLLLIAGAALFLRVGAALVTEKRPIFPAYYYQDAVFVDDLARATVSAWSRGESLPLNCAPNRRLLVWATAGLYRVFGIRPLAPKLANAALGALGVLFLGIAAARAAGPEAALWSAGAAALWPSAVFYTSQNLKEAPVIAFFWLAYALLLPDGDPDRPRPGRWTAGVAALVAAGLLRSYSLIVVAAALAATAAWAAAGRKRSRVACAGLAAAALSAPIAYKIVTATLYERLVPAAAGEHYLDTALVPRVVDQDYKVESLTDPKGVSAFRSARQGFDRWYARQSSNREIATQIFPDAKFETWFDVAAFVPKGSFYALFMPLPGAYPMDGKIGRIFAAAENAVLLLVAGLALVRAAKGPRNFARVALLLSFAGMTAVSGLFDFDLGSAGRHKLLYLPMLFPFAAEQALRLLGRKERA